MSTRIQLRRGRKAFWESENPILFPGEPGVEVYPGQPYKLKIGDGETPWNELPYSPRSLSEIPDGELPATLEEHILDESPHPAYDNGPSLVLLYENAKV